MRDHTVLPATHMFIHKWNEPYLPGFTPQPRSITALWPVLISRSAEGRRLSWPACLGEILKWFARRMTVAHHSISRGGRESNSRPSIRKSNAITTRLPSHLKIYRFVQGSEYGIDRLFVEAPCVGHWCVLSVISA